MSGLKLSLDTWKPWGKRTHRQFSCQRSESSNKTVQLFLHHYTFRNRKISSFQKNWRFYLCRVGQKSCVHHYFRGASQGSSKVKAVHPRIFARPRFLSSECVRCWLKSSRLFRSLQVNRLWFFTAKLQHHPGWRLLLARFATVFFKFSYSSVNLFQGPPWLSDRPATHGAHLRDLSGNLPSWKKTKNAKSRMVPLPLVLGLNKASSTQIFFITLFCVVFALTILRVFSLHAPLLLLIPLPPPALLPSPPHSPHSIHNSPNCPLSFHANQASNHSTSQKASTHQSIHQSINKSNHITSHQIKSNQWINQSNQSINQSMNPINQINQSINQTTNKPT